MSSSVVDRLCTSSPQPGDEEVLSRHAVDDSNETPLKVRQYWRTIGNYCLVFGGTHGHATGTCRAAENAREIVCVMKRRIFEESLKNEYCLSDAFNC